MIAQEELKELLQILKEKGVIRVDSSLRLINDTFFSKTELINRARKKQDVDKTFNFFIGLYECHIKKKLYKINVFFAPRDQILVPAKEVFDEIKTTMFKRLVEIRRIDLNNYHNKKIIPTPYNNFMDLLANEYYVIGTQKDSLVVNKLKKKLRRHRLRHLKEKTVLKNINFPKTDLGDSVKTLLSVLNTETRQRRSRRKKVNKAIRKKKTKLKNQIKQNRLQKLKNETLIYERRESRLKKLKEKKEALIYLERLKTYEKACKGTDLNPLDILFSPLDNKKIT